MVGAFLTLKQTVNTLKTVYDKIENGTIKDSVKNRDVALFMANGSIVRLLSTFIIEPTIVISKNLREEEITEKLAEINVDIFASFYLQAFNVLTNVYKFDTSTAFDILSSKGGIIKNPTSNMKFGIEDFDETLNILPIKERTFKYLSMESKPNPDAKQAFMDEVARTVKNTIANSNLNNNNSSNKNNSVINKGNLKENKNISVPTMLQKELEITQKITVNGSTTEVVIPMIIKATIIYSEFNNIQTMIATNDRDKTFSSRLDEFRSGMISMRDLVFADDLIKEYKNNKIKDKDHLIDFMETRATNANSKVMTQGAIGLNKFYGILIVSKNQMSIIEQKLGGSIDKPRYKEMLMNQTKSLIINTVDTDWERVSIDIKDLKGTTDLSYKVINNKKGSNNASELADVFKAMSSNKQPAF